MTKKKMLTISFVLTILFSALVVAVDIYHYDFCDYSCQRTIINTGESFFFFPFVLVFSLITYFSPDRVFQSWWKFARIGIPVAFILSLLINLEVHHSPGGQWEDIFDIPALILIYGVFTLGSIWQIWKGFKQK